MPFRFISLLFLSLLSIAAITGCELPEDKQIYAGQECIDAATTAADADRCYNLVSGLTSEKAYLIRCSSHYVAQGFTGQRFASAFQRLKDGSSSGQDPMATAMAYMVFSVSSTLHTADTAVSDCNLSGVRSMKRLATMTKLATFVAQQGLGSIPDPNAGGFNPSQISTAITNLVNSNDPTANATIGALAQQANEQYCNAGSSFSGNEVCTNIQNAINNGGGNTATIGAQLLVQLQTNSH